MLTRYRRFVIFMLIQEVELVKYEGIKLACKLQFGNCMGFSLDKVQVRGLNKEIEEENRG